MENSRTVSPRTEQSNGENLFTHLGSFYRLRCNVAQDILQIYKHFSLGMFCEKHKQVIRLTAATIFHVKWFAWHKQLNAIQQINSNNQFYECDLRLTALHRLNARFVVRLLAIFLVRRSSPDGSCVLVCSLCSLCSDVIFFASFAHAIQQLVWKYFFFCSLLVSIHSFRICFIASQIVEYCANCSSFLFLLFFFVFFLLPTTHLRMQWLLIRSSKPDKSTKTSWKFYCIFLFLLLFASTSNIAQFRCECKFQMRLCPSNKQSNGYRSE